MQQGSDTESIQAEVILINRLIDTVILQPSFIAGMDAAHAYLIADV